MRGHIKQRAKGSWSIVIDLGRDPLTGKRRQQWTTVKGTKKEAEKKLSELQRQMDTGSYVKPSKETVATFLQQWLDDYISARVRPKTLEGYRQRGKHLIESLGHILLTELRQGHILTYYREKGETLSPATLVKHQHLLKQALATAQEWHLITKNVAEGKGVKPPRVAKKEMRALSGSEVHRMLEACEGTPWHPIFHTLVWTGLRRSELLGLQWKNVELLLATLRVTRGLHQLNDGTFDIQEPKSNSSRRTIALSPASCLVLRAHMETQERDAEILGTRLSDDSLVFSHPDGSPRVPSTLTLAFRRLAKRIGLEGVRLHDLRHSMASLYLEQGVNPKTVAERLGHSSVSITLDLYSHCLPGVQESAAAQFDLAMESARLTPAKWAPAQVR